MEALYLTVLRQDRTITMDLSDVNPVVPRSQIRVEDDLLTEMGAELSRLSALANQTVALQTRQATASPPAHDDALRQLGEQLFMQLFPAPTRQRLMHMAPSHLFLRLDDQLVHLPWELAFDGQDFLLHRFHIGRQVVTHQRPARPLQQAVGPSDILKILLVVDPTETLDAAIDEAEYLCSLLDLCDNVEVEMLSGKQLRKLDLLRALNHCDLVHYAGHAFFDAEQPDRSGWILHDAVLTAAELSRVARPPKLVFSNACQAGVTSRWTTEAIYEDQAFGIGSAFLLAGAQNYIGTFCVIHDTHSATFAAHFYQHLLQGAPVGVALTRARRHARQHADESGLLWASYMHYGNPAFQLLSEAVPETATSHVQSTPPQLEAAGWHDFPEAATPLETPPERERGVPHGRGNRPTEPEAPAAPARERRFLTRSWAVGVGVLVVLGLGLAWLAITPWRQTSPELAVLPTAYQWIEQGEHDKAKAYFQPLTTHRTARLRGEGYAGLAALALAQGASEQALAYVDKAGQSDPQLASGEVVKGHVLWQQGQVHQAAEAYRTALNRAHQLPQLAGMVHNRLGLMFASQGETDRALNHYERASESHTDTAAVLVNKGYLLDKLGRHEEALDLYRQALARDPDEPLAAILSQDLERRQQLAQDTAKRAHIDQLVAELLEAHRAHRPQAPSQPDSWTSRPLTLAVLEMEKPALPIARAGEAEALWLRLSQALQDNPRLHMVEREVLEALLSEMKLGTSALVQPQTALQVGQILAARFMATGRFLRLGTHGQFSVRVIETEKTRITASTTVDVATPAQTRQVAEAVASMLAERLRQAYPLRGRITGVESQTATLNIGAEHGVVAGLRLYAYQGDDARIDKVAALLEVTAVDATQAHVRVQQHTMALQVGWKVEEVRAE